MRNLKMALLVLVANLAGCSASTPKKLFLDVHDVGPGKVTTSAVAAAHQKDSALQRKYGVELNAIDEVVEGR